MTSPTKPCTPRNPLTYTYEHVRDARNRADGVVYGLGEGYGATYDSLDYMNYASYEGLPSEGRDLSVKFLKAILVHGRPYPIFDNCYVVYRSDGLVEVLPHSVFHLRYEAPYA